MKASGYVVIGSGFAIKGVAQTNGTNQEGENKNFIYMPFHQTAAGGYYSYAKPITIVTRDKINNAVQDGIKNIDRCRYEGVKFTDPGDKDSTKWSGRYTTSSWRL